MRRAIATAPRAALAALLLAAAAPAAEDVFRIVASEDEIPRIRAKTRHTTVIRLPEDEEIVDFVLGDSEYWGVAGSGHIAYLKPSGSNVQTNLALVCASGRIYSLLAKEGGEPHLAVYIERAPEPGSGPGAVGTPVHEPAFVPRHALRDAEDVAALATDRAREAVSSAQRALEEGVARHKAEYPRELRFPYEVEDKAADWPFMVEGMWHDGKVTYIRCLAPEAPAIYEMKDGKPAMVGYDLRDHVYVTQHVLGDGWFQIGKLRRHWRIPNPEALAAQIEAAAERGP